MKMAARRRLGYGTSDAEASDTDGNARRRRHKRSKQSEGRDAPYIRQYRVKKGIEKELDDIDFWNEKSAEITVPIVDNDTVLATLIELSKHLR